VGTVGENDNDEINVQACPTCTNNQNGQFLFTDGGPGGTESPWPTLRWAFLIRIRKLGTVHTHLSREHVRRLRTRYLENDA
jgi:hypothetical protein